MIDITHLTSHIKGAEKCLLWKDIPDWLSPDVCPWQESILLPVTITCMILGCMWHALSSQLLACLQLLMELITDVCLLPPPPPLPPPV